MDYFLTTSLAQPSDLSLVSPKTHVPGSRLQERGQRFHSPGLGRWINRDPIVEEGNIYSFNSNDEINNTDYLGLWQDLGGDIWKAEAGDILGKLAKNISGNAADWECVWPVKYSGAVASYPAGLKPCDTFDVSNLTTKKANSVAVEVAADANSANWATFFGATSFNNTAAVVARIKTASKEGATPLSELIVVGHSAPGFVFIGGSASASPSDFGASDLVSAAYSGSQTFARANAKQGPLRCWFNRTAKARGSACNSKDWASAFAKKVLRKGAKAYGTTASLWYIGSTEAWIGSGTHYSTPSGLFGGAGWKSYGGGL